MNNNLCTIRNVLFKAFLVNILFVMVFWAYAMTDLVQYFMWALPGFTVESANLYIMWLVGAVDVAGLVLFLVPCLAITWTLSKKPRPAMAARPAARSAAAKPAVKPKSTKRKRR